MLGVLLQLLLLCRQTPLSPYSPYPSGRLHEPGSVAHDLGLLAAAPGMKRMRETPPQERMRNARRAVKRLRHETRYCYAPCNQLLFQASLHPCLHTCL